jgi:hypothetical protein
LNPHSRDAKNITIANPSGGVDSGENSNAAVGVPFCNINGIVPPRPLLTTTPEARAVCQASRDKRVLRHGSPEVASP